MSLLLPPAELNAELKIRPCWMRTAESFFKLSKESVDSTPSYCLLSQPRADKKSRSVHPEHYLFLSCSDRDALGEEHSFLCIHVHVCTYAILCEYVALTMCGFICAVAMSLWLCQCARGVLGYWDTEVQAFFGKESLLLPGYAQFLLFNPKYILYMQPVGWLLVVLVTWVLIHVVLV